MLAMKSLLARLASSAASFAASISCSASLRPVMSREEQMVGMTCVSRRRYAGKDCGHLSRRVAGHHPCAPTNAQDVCVDGDCRLIEHIVQNDVRGLRPHAG